MACTTGKVKGKYEESLRIRPHRDVNMSTGMSWHESYRNNTPIVILVVVKECRTAEDLSDLS